MQNYLSYCPNTDRLQRFGADLFAALNRLLGIDIFICEEGTPGSDQRHSSRSGFFALERHRADAVSTQYWGFGYYAVVSRLPEPGHAD